MSNGRNPRRLGSVVQRTRGALRVLRGDSPAYLVAARQRDAEVDDLIARDVLDLTLRMGEALLSAGSPVAGVTATMLRVAAAYGLTSVQVDITFTSITLSVMRDDGEPVTTMRVVKVRAADYSRLQAMHGLADDIAAGLPLQEALQRLDEIVHAPHPYRRWLVTLAFAGMAAGITGLLGGGPAVAALAAAATAGIDRIQRRLNKWGLPSFFQQAAAAAFVTLIAVAVLVLGDYLPLELQRILRPSLVVGAGITVLLAGLGVVGSAEDAISGHYLTAGARTFEVALNTVGIVVGVGAVLDIAHRFGLPLDVEGDLPSVRPTALIPIAAVVSGFWALSSYARWRAALVAAAGGGVAYVVYAVITDIGVGPAVASATAALFIGAIADVAGDRTKVPTLVVAMSGVVPFLPGLTTYRGIFNLVQDETLLGISGLLNAASIGLGLAAGVALGSFAARPLRSEVDRWERRVRRRAQAPRD